MRAIIGLLHADMHQSGTVGSVCHLATSVITVAPGARGDEAVAKITKRSKSGKVMQDVSRIYFWGGIRLLSYNVRNILTVYFSTIGGGFYHQRGLYSYCTEQAQPTWTQTH